MQVLGVSLAVRQYSPKLQMYRQLAEQQAVPPADACCWVVAAGALFTDPAELRAALTKGTMGRASGMEGSSLFAFDHIYQPSGRRAVNVSDPGVLGAVLYAPMGSQCAADFHAVLKEVVEELGSKGEFIAHT